MKILLIGSGGREHAMAWKTAQSPLCTQLFIAPGNPGTAKLGTNVVLDINKPADVIEFCQQNRIDLVLVGPEIPLANGLVDALQNNTIKAFGPNKLAARIESSKSFSKSFMEQFHIPTAKFAAFTSPEKAKTYLANLPYDFVIKADGLTGGKGVYLPNTQEEAFQIIDELMSGTKFGASGKEIIIEERLTGPEISLMAFSDGHTAAAMRPAQDHKRLLDGQQGPNTGGMGAYAPVPFCTKEQIHEMMNQVILPAIQGMQKIGCPFVGILYAGLMLTPQGIKVLEFNCRFGDPETQVVLPLLESDLVQIALDCINGTLNPGTVVWKDHSAVTVVLASANYPGKVTTGIPIEGLEQEMEDTFVFHAGTSVKDQQIITAGGRVLNVTAFAPNLDAAIDLAYLRVNKIHFQGMQYRKDIAQQNQTTDNSPSAYALAGVNINAGMEAVQRIKQHVQATYNQHVLSNMGSFGGLFSLDSVEDIKHPVLVASTDGVGTKVKLAAQYHRLQGIGEDIVNHCIDDILVQGAKPLFFLDYYATSALHPEDLQEILAGMSRACLQAGCVILGGETAEMPGVYCLGEFDLAGTIVGVVSKDAILPRQNIQPGDVLIGLSSSGPHTNGFSLIRKIFSDENLDNYFPEIDGNLAEALLAPHKNYYPLLKSLLNQTNLIKAMAHITGGGFIDNIPRVLPSTCSVHIKRSAWKIPPLYGLIQQKGHVALEEMFRVFNMGIGMILIIAKEDIKKVQSLIPESNWIIGEVISGSGKVEFDD